MPKVSVYIPVYNREKYIEKAISGILNQTFKDFELLIIDDGSTDASLEKVKSFNDPRIKIYQNDGNKGIVYTRNRAFELATGTYLAINDSDDFSYPDRLEKQVAVMDANPKIGILGGIAKRIYSDTKFDYWRYPCTSEDIKLRLFWGSAMINSTLLLRLEFFKTHPLRYNPDFPVAEDYDLFERSQEFFQLQNLDDTLIDYYSHSENLTHSQNDKMKDCAFQINNRQLVKLDIVLLEKEVEVWKKLFFYEFNFSIEELQVLLKISTRIINQNAKYNYYASNEFAKDLARRLYFCFYNAGQSQGFSMFKASLFWEVINLSRSQQIKFFIKQRL
jgi:glycosyltransferase involved in cell wall biosynthesis